MFRLPNRPFKLDRTPCSDSTGQTVHFHRNTHCTLALRAIEFRLKLRGVIQDRRISHHHYLDQAHPDADVEHLDPNAQEELDTIRLISPAKVPPAKVLTPPAPAAIEPPAKLASRAQQQPDSKPVPHVPQQIVTPISDLSRLSPECPTGSLFSSTSLTTPMPPPARRPASRFQVPAAA